MGLEAGGARTRDAVVVVPGIMGSALVEAESGETLWGFDQADSWVNAWTTERQVGADAVHTLHVG